MGLTKPYPPCLPLVAAFSRHATALENLWQTIIERVGPIALLSPSYDFVESEYYHTAMGRNLKKQFAILQPWYDPAELATHKLLCNSLEQELANARTYSEPRPLNIDPGYMSMTKLVLASTKNREHRIYLRDGIYAEVTLAFRNQAWVPMPWTYPDYQREDFRVFFSEARKLLATRVAETNRDERKTPLSRRSHDVPDDPFS